MQFSGLAFIQVTNNNPFDLFREWQEEVTNVGFSYLQANSMCLATTSKEGKIANRNVLMKAFNEDGFIFVTDMRGRKAKEMREIPQVAVTFVWLYEKDNKQISKQVRIEGNATEITREKCEKIYDDDSTVSKIRSHLCRQNEEIDWKEHKKKHDQLLQDFLSKKNALPMPEHYGGFQIVPEKMDFYYAWNEYIADRVVFSKIDKNEWKYVHVAA